MQGNCQEGLLEKWFIAEHLPHISVPSVQLPSNTDEAVETTDASHHQGTPDFPDRDQAEHPLDAFANLNDALIELEKDDEMNSTLHALNHSPREVTKRNNFTLPEVNQSGKIVLSGGELLFAGITDLDDGESIWLGSYEVGEDVPSGMQEPDEEDGFATAIQLASDEFDRIFQENIRAAQAPNYPLWTTPNGHYDLRDWLVLVYRHWHSRPYLRSQALTGWLRDTHNIFKDTKSVRTFIERLKCSGTASFFLRHPHLLNTTSTFAWPTQQEMLQAGVRDWGGPPLFEWALGCWIRQRQLEGYTPTPTTIDAAAKDIWSRIPCLTDSSPPGDAKVFRVRYNIAARENGFPPPWPDLGKPDVGVKEHRGVSTRSKGSNSAWNKGDDACLISAAADKRNERVLKNGLLTGELDWKRIATIFPARSLKAIRTRIYVLNGQRQT